METIKSNAEISQLFSDGKKIESSTITLIILNKQHDHPGRVAFLAGKKNGNAVWRNGAKRRLREICRSLGGPWVGYDVVFIAKRRIMKAPYSKVLATCEDLLKKNWINNG